MSTVTVNDMKARLLPLGQIEERLVRSEPLSAVTIEDGTPAIFNYEPGWNADLDHVEDHEVVDAFVTAAGHEYQMSKEAALMACSRVGLPAAYARKAPGSLIGPHLNHWYGQGLTEDLSTNMILVGDRASAFIRPTLVPFSNLSLLEQAVEGIYAQYGADTEILADYKFAHTMSRTDIRLIVPEHSRTMTDTNMTDVPTGAADLWSAGIHLSNSLTAKTPTSVEAYLFRWWCTNGATTVLDQTGVWSRRSSGQGLDVYVWAREAVDEVLGGLESRFNEVQALAGVNLAGHTADALRDVFARYEVPVTQRNAVLDEMLESETLTLYAVMNALSQTANEPGMSPERVDRMTRIAGAMPRIEFDQTKALIWREGNAAPKEAPNPYAIHGPTAL